MILRYGLNRLGDYGGPIHIAGDYADTVLEQEIEYRFDTIRWMMWTILVKFGIGDRAWQDVLVFGR